MEIMSKTTGLIICLGASLLIANAQAAEDMSAAEYFARDKANNWTGELNTEGPWGQLGAKPRQLSVEKKAIAEQIKKAVASKLGQKWVPTALQLAKIESNYTCRAQGPITRHGRAKGLFQILDSSAVRLGFEPGKMLNCEANLAAAIAHMQRCLEHGVVSAKDMASCHVAGWDNWNRQLTRKAERYRQSYIRMARLRYRD